RRRRGRRRQCQRSLHPSDLSHPHHGGRGEGIPAPAGPRALRGPRHRSEEHTSELQSRFDLVCRLLLEKKKQRGKRREKTEEESDIVKEHESSNVEEQ